MIVRILAFALCSALSVSAQAVEYKCKGPGGEWAEKYCTGAAAPKESDLARSLREKREDEAKANSRRLAWFELCEAAGGDWGGKCSKRHADAYEYMRQMLSDSTITEQAKTKALACYAKWYKETVGAVDAVMWRYCFVN